MESFKQPNTAQFGTLVPRSRRTCEERWFLAVGGHANQTMKRGWPILSDDERLGQRRAVTGS